MSNPTPGSRFTRRYMAIALWFIASHAFAQTPASQPTSQAGKARPPATQPVEEGSVQEAMRHLFTIPRPRTSHERSPSAPANQKRANDLPYSKVLPGPDAGPLADARRSSPRRSSDRTSGAPNR